MSEDDLIVHLRNSKGWAFSECGHELNAYGKCDLCQKAADTIERLQAKLEQTVRERDAAVAALKAVPSCKTCKHNNWWNCIFHESHECMAFDDYGKLSHPMWEWRWPQEVYHERK